MALLQRFITIALAVLAVVWFDINNCSVDADVSPLQLRRMRAAQQGGTSTSVFVRGMMAADHQMELYMTMMASDDQDEEKIIASSRHNRYDASGRIGNTKNDVISVSRGGGSSSHRGGGGCIGGPVMHMQRTVGQARDVAMNFANTLLLRQRTFVSTPIPSRRRQ